MQRYIAAARPMHISKWSWQEMAKYDLPATIDIVLETSKKKNLYFIGHSQGK